jgi:hypothetical protein
MQRSQPADACEPCGWFGPRCPDARHANAGSDGAARYGLIRAIASVNTLRTSASVVVGSLLGQHCRVATHFRGGRSPTRPATRSSPTRVLFRRCARCAARRPLQPMARPRRNRRTTRRPSPPLNGSPPGSSSTRARITPRGAAVLGIVYRGGRHVNGRAWKAFHQRGRAEVVIHIRVRESIAAQDAGGIDCRGTICRK